MTSQGEKIGAALAKAMRGTAAKWKEGDPAPTMYRTNLRDVPKVEGLKRDDGWVDMQVQFLIDKKTANADHVVGWTVLKPGARHENHRHHNCDEFFIVLKGKGHIYTDKGEVAFGRRRRRLFAARLLARIQQHVERRCRSCLGMDGRRIHRSVRLRSASREPQVNAWDSPLIKKGMTAQLAKRRARMAAGEKPLGWKVGLGAPATMERLKLAAPVIGFLMQRGLLLSGSTAPIGGYIKPVAEPEICVRMARDLPSDASADEAAAAIKEIFPAIELADLDPAPTLDNLDAVLEGNIFQRHVVLCGNTRAGAATSGLTSRVFRRGKETNVTTDPEALTGKLPDIVAHVASTLAAFGEKLAAGDVIITGSITPPLIIEPDETELVHVLEPIGEVSIRFSRD